MRVNREKLTENILEQICIYEISKPQANSMFAMQSTAARREFNLFLLRSKFVTRIFFPSICPIWADLFANRFFFFILLKHRYSLT